MWNASSFLSPVFITFWLIHLVFSDPITLNLRVLCSLSCCVSFWWQWLRLASMCAVPMYKNSYVEKLLCMWHYTWQTAVEEPNNFTRDSFWCIKEKKQWRTVILFIAKCGWWGSGGRSLSGAYDSSVAEMNPWFGLGLVFFSPYLVQFCWFLKMLLQWLHKKSPV